MGPFSKQEQTAITTLGVEFAVAELLGAGVGLYLDKKWGTTPWIFLVGVAAGFALGLYMVIRGVQDLERRAPQEKK